MELSMPSLAAVFGYAGIAANVTWTLMHKRSKLLAWQAVACGLMLMHFALLGAQTGALIMLVAGVQAVLAIPLGKSPKFKRIYIASLVLTPMVCYLTWQGPQSVFSSLALAIVCVANFQLNQVYQRTLLLSAIFAWVAHNLLVSSFPGLISNALAFCISSIMLFKVMKQEKSNALNPSA
jgi:Bacterial inner membrane protein